MRHFVILVVLLSSFYATAQSGKWYTNADREVSSNTTFRVEFILENAKGSSFKAPNFEGLQVVGGPMSSSSTQIINGKASSKQSYIYEVIALKEGTVTVGSAAIKVNKVQYNTTPVKIKVVKGKNLSAMLGGDDMTIKMELSDSIAYPGQQVMLNYILYYKDQVRFSGIVEEDEYKGLYAQSIQGTNQTKRVIQNGEVFQSSVIRQMAIFPQKSGDFTFKPLVVKIGIPQKSNARRGFFSFQQYDNKIVTADPVTLRVRELPQGAPDNFTGAVGTFEVTTAINKNTTTTDDAIVMHLTVKGDGDIRLLNAPQLALNDNWEVYEPTVVEENEFVQSNKILNYKKFEYLLLPKATGQLSVAPSFTYFDLDSVDYETEAIRPFYVNVTQGNRKVLAEDSKILSDKEISGLMTARGPSIRSNPFTSVWYLGGLGLLLIGSGGMFVKKKQNDNYSSLSKEERQRLEAEKVARTKLSKAKEYLDQSNSKLYFEEISTAMNGYLADKYNIPHSEISKDLLRSKLQDQFGNSAIPSDYYQLLQNCEMALFAGQTSDNKMTEIYNLSLDLISRIATSN